MKHEHSDAPRSNAGPSRAKWVFVAFVAIAAYFVIAEHRAHLSGLLYYLPFLLLLLCPLLHVFMHGRHGHHTGEGHRRGHSAEQERK
jgi:hypothetical protein